MMRAGPQPKAEPRSRGGGTPARPFFAGPTQRRPEAEAPALQARLAVGAPGDRWEREADRMAGEVVSGHAPAPPGQVRPADRVTPVTAAALREEAAQRQAEPETAAPEEDAALQRAPDDDIAVKDEATPLAGEAPAQMRGEATAAASEDDPARHGTKDEAPAQARGMGPGGPDAMAEAARAMARARGAGDPLPPLVMDRMESRFGADFEGIRIHTDSAAVQITQALRAQAVTRGRDIYFNAGRFAPDSRDGAELLAHELTHTLQQGAAPAAADSAAGRADPLQMVPEPAPQADPAADSDSYQVRPEILTAIRLARGEAGRVNSKAHGPDGKRIGWQRLQLYFTTALGGPVIDPRIIERVTPVPASKDGSARADALPSWCGIFTWWAMKEAGLPLPDWTLGRSALDALKLRDRGELPRKGDIAILVKPNNHFAMVTGLEAARDAAGKPRRLTRIATINGNTAGNDNLGGQVQEKWNTLADWDHFLDPAGKLSLPPAPMVTVGRAPDPVETTPQAAPKADPAAAEASPATAEQAGARAGTLDDLEAAPVETPPEEAALGAEALPQADLTLPPAPPAGPAEVVAEVAAVALEGTSDQATAAWLGASPSAMAAAQPVLAATVSGKLAAEQQDLAANPPALTARTSGLDGLPDATPPETVLPAGEVDAAEATNDPGPLDPVKTDAPPAYAAGADHRRKLAEEETGSFWDAFIGFLKSLIADIGVTDPSVGTKAGAAPGVELSGDADAARMDSQRGDASEAVGAARDAQVTAFREHPGQAAIQPVKVDESFEAAPVAEAAEPLESLPDPGMAAYAAAPLPADVRAAADGRLGQTLDAALAGPRAEVTAAATTRDSDRADAIATAETEATRINTEADAAQKKAVLDNRAEVARLQGEGMTEAQGAVNAFNREAASEQAATRKAIGTHVRAEEEKARGKITEGETKAEGLKTTAEAEARAEKAALEKEEKNDSWWDKGKAFVKGAVKAVTEAIDTIFTTLRTAVAGVIEAAKNAAIGLINAARDFVITQINDFRDWAKTQVDTYVAETFPGLARRINGAIDTVADVAVTVVNTVADGAVAAVELAAKVLSRALDGILRAFQTGLKAAVRIAAAAATGDFAEALRVAIEAACEIAGIDPAPVFGFFDRAGTAIDTILKDPVGFFSRLAGAVGAGIGAFFTNIRTHLIAGAIGWLTGALAEVQLTGPFEFTVSGILKIVLQILGLTYGAIRARVIKAYPPAAGVFDLVESGLEIVKRLATEGPLALLDEIMAQLGNIRDIVMGAVREWLIVTAIKQGVVWLLALTNPASAIVKAVMLVYDLVMFLIERMQQIRDFVMTVYEAVAEVVAGNLSAVTVKVEEALARSVPVLISLLASVLSLGNIAAKVKSVIAKVTKPINKVVDAVVRRIVAFARKVAKKAGTLARKTGRKVKAAGVAAKKKAGETVEKIATWWKERRKFRSRDGGNHQMFYKGSAEKADLWVASQEQLISDFLAAKQTDKDATPEERAAANRAAGQYQVILAHETALEQKRAARARVPTTDKPAYRAATGAVNSEIAAFRKAMDVLSKILQTVDFGREDDALVQTHVAPAGKGAKNVQALPLTYLSGNTRGSGPGREPPGWDHAVKLDTRADGTSASTWVRGHLLNDNLHGPGTDWNLVPITKDMNSKMEADVESPAKSAIRERGKLYFYRAEVTFWSDPAPVGHFPKSIDVTWGTARRDPKDKKTFVEGKANPTVSIDMKTKPDATATGYVPSINGGSATQLERAIRPHGRVTAYFVSDVLLADFEDHGPYSSKTNMHNRLYTDVRTSLIRERGASVAADRRTYVKATYEAIGAGAVKV